MQHSRLHSITRRFSRGSLRSAFRRSSDASSRTTSSRNSLASCDSAISTINSVMIRQASVIGMEEERRSFGPELSILEPRPVVYWGGLEERMGSF